MKSPNHEAHRYNWRNRHGQKLIRPAKVEKVMEEFKSGELHSGSKKGPAVTNRKQAIAIALSEARKNK